MPATPSQSSSTAQTAIILERLDSIKSETGENKAAIACLNNNLQALITEWNREHAKIVIKVDQEERRLNDHDEQIAKIEKSIEVLATTIESLKSRIELMLWVGGIIAGAVILYGVNQVLIKIFPGIP